MLNELAKKIHGYAKEKGWWKNPRSPLEIHMLCVTELAEASEEVRNNHPPVWVTGVHGAVVPIEHLAWESFVYTDKDQIKHLKPEGELIELADTMIRILDYCGFKGWDIEKAIEIKVAFNLTRSERHGGKVL